MQPVIISRTLQAPVEKVFAAWSKPELLRQWFAAGANWVENAEVDFRTGGEYKIVIADAEGTNTVFGYYRRIEIPTLVEFTWQWEQSSFETGQSLVTVQLEPAGQSTEMTLIHTNLASELSEQRHSAGWDHVLARLLEFVHDQSA